jgi:hypothetical protein
MRRRNGHAPGHIREAFKDLVNAAYNSHWRGPDYTEAFTPKEIKFLLDALRDCTDIMPCGYCQDMDLVPGATFADGVQRWEQDFDDDEEKLEQSKSPELQKELYERMVQLSFNPDDTEKNPSPGDPVPQPNRDRHHEQERSTP